MSEYYEGVNVQDVFVSDLHHVENLGVCSRLMFVVKKTIAGVGCVEGAVALIVPNDRLAVISALLLRPPGETAEPQTVERAALN